MTRVLLGLAAVALLGGILRWYATRRAYWEEPNYVRQIAVLKPDKPLALPKIRDLVGRVVEEHEANVLRFMGRRR